MVWLTELIRNSIIVLFTFSWLYSLMGSSISFWMAWLIIPLIMEIIPAMGNFVILINRKRRRSHQEKEWHLGYEPEISLIIPVYNSEGTLYRCLESVYRSNYPAKKIHIILSNNESTDRSFQIFTESQSAFPEMVMTWVDAKQGKSKALNLALFNSNSKYIIHIDSDGILHKDALRNMIILFENDLEIDSVTGTVVVDPVEIEATERFGKRLLRKLEFFEYCQAFLAGRNFQAEFNAIYTMSGAFSAFRKSAILRTQLFNTDTVSEDTHLTFQLRETLGSKITICNEAIFFVDPIEGVNELYAQRQRWQMGEIEVIHIFMRNRLNAVRGMLGSFILRILIYDHTFAFPRMIWYFALICLLFLNYPLRLIVLSFVLIFLLYVFAGFLYYLNILIFLKPLPELRKYYSSKWYLVILLPAFNFMVFWFRFAGILNSINGQKVWKTLDLTAERKAAKAVLMKDFAWFLRLKNKGDSLINH